MRYAIVFTALTTTLGPALAAPAPRAQGEAPTAPDAPLGSELGGALGNLFGRDIPALAKTPEIIDARDDRAELAKQLGLPEGLLKRDVKNPLLAQILGESLAGALIPRQGSAPVASDGSDETGVSPIATAPTAPDSDLGSGIADTISGLLNGRQILTPEQIQHLTANTGEVPPAGVDIFAKRDFESAPTAPDTSAGVARAISSFLNSRQIDAARLQELLGDIGEIPPSKRDFESAPTAPDTDLGSQIGSTISGLLNGRQIDAARLQELLGDIGEIPPSKRDFQSAPTAPDADLGGVQIVTPDGNIAISKRQILTPEQIQALTANTGEVPPAGVDIFARRDGECRQPLVSCFIGKECCSGKCAKRIGFPTAVCS